MTAQFLLLSLLGTQVPQPLKAFRTTFAQESREEAIWSLNEAGALDGPWLTFHPNGLVAVVGWYSNGRPSGVWQYFWSDGTVAGEVGHRSATAEQASLTPKGLRFPCGKVRRATRGRFLRLSCVDKFQVEYVGVFADGELVELLSLHSAARDGLSITFEHGVKSGEARMRGGRLHGAHIITDKGHEPVVIWFIDGVQQPVGDKH
jgi:hypothetical protein